MDGNNRSLFLWGGLALAVVLILAASLYFVSSPDSPAVIPGTSGSLTMPVSGTDNIRGPATAPVTLVEYNDFECPACGAYSPVLERLLASFPNDLRLVYRHFPLSQHRGAWPAALAAEAAGEQGQFWEMAALIFDNQDAWSGRNNVAAIFRGYAEQLKLDLIKFDSSLKSQAISQKITRQKNSGTAAGVDATPTFYLNGRKIVNPRSYDDFANLIKAELNR